MKWYKATEYKPKWGTQFCVVDKKNGTLRVLSAFFNEEDWTGDMNRWPDHFGQEWAYLSDEHEPIHFQPERLSEKTSKDDAIV